MTADRRGPRWVLVGGGIVLLLAVGMLLVPFLVRVDHFRPAILRLVEQSTGRIVTADNLRLHLLPTVHLQMTNVHLKNPQGFPDGDTLVVRSLEIGTTLSSVFARRLDVTGIGLNGVDANLLETTGGKTNYDFSKRAGGSRPSSAWGCRRR